MLGPATLGCRCSKGLAGTLSPTSDSGRGGIAERFVNPVTVLLVLALSHLHGISQCLARLLRRLERPLEPEEVCHRYSARLRDWT